ncbi:MAG: DNA helicase RecQ [Ruminococcus sp.]|nr:DNA helicase RecQ [Ruminococcus sp.]MCM1381423.1 DNA helicase RecQ [Muribaculaceae bacterium]MCM1479031.1 DNA helicase RecQ [Muribaculaceae bacterium]
MNRCDVLRKYFGYSSFRRGQEEITDSILSGRDTLGVMPTGAGKSICYQVPALMFEGITLVISPLISLMQDQVTALVQSGIRAAYINSSLTQNQLAAVLRNAEGGMYKLIYVAPERLESGSFLSFAENARISMVTVDEAHCISQWGQDFRPSYTGIPKFIGKLPVRPVVTAFTATATDRVRQDIVRLLEMNAPYTLVTGFDRKNLYFEVRSPRDRNAALTELVKKYSSEGRSGIVYCSTRKNVEKITETLSAAGISVTSYHGGMDETERTVNQNDFIYDRKNVMVATNAFGMGIDKSNVSYVIHCNMPKDLESYYQEAGRAGRDGSPADCILLYSGADIHTAKFLINSGYERTELSPEEIEVLKSRDLKRLNDMIGYCTGTECLRGYILKYFGEDASGECGNCSRCCSDEPYEDVTVEAQKIMSCIIRAGQRYGVKMICGILRGEASDRISAAGLDKLSTYGIMADVSEKRIRNITDKLIASGYVEKTEGEYPILRVRQSAAAVLKGNEKVTARLPREEEPKRGKQTAQSAAYKADPELLGALKSLRAEIAAEQGVPAYVVFADAALIDMCGKLPRSDGEFLSVSGVGAVKLERYGAAFMKVIADYLEENPGIEAEEVPVRKMSNTEMIRGCRMRTKREARQIFAEISAAADRLVPDSEPLTISVLAERIVGQSGVNVSAAVFRRAITDWLKSEGFIAVYKDGEGKNQTDTAELSESVGIFSEERVSMRGAPYKRIMYTPEAQRFIIDNIGAIGEEFAGKLEK